MFSALLALAICPASTGPSIAGETRYDPHGLVRLRAEGVKAGAAVLWRVYPRLGVERATTKPEILEFAAPPGTYEIECLVFTQGATGLEVQEVFTRVTIGPSNSVTPKAGKLDAVNALGRIRFGNAGCTATVIGPRRPDGKWDVLTAAHCVPGVGSVGTMTLKDGRTIKLTVAVHQEDADLAWCVTEDSIDEISYALISAEDPPVGTKVWHMGYGIDKPGNREEGVVDGDRDSNGQLRMIMSVSSGDSGGGIFRTDTNELISTVCCTAGLAQRARMWGASTHAILKARPVPATRGCCGPWLPLPMPTIIEIR